MPIHSFSRRTFLAGMLALMPLGAAAAERVTVFAAASLGDVLQDAAAAFARHADVEVVVAAAGSSVLARQIAAGAPADLFVSANTDWMDVLERDGLIRAGTRANVARNTLVLVAHDAGAVALSPDLDLAALLGEGRLAVALTEAVPAGIYARAALRHLGLWEAAAPRLAEADNVRAALALVAMGEAPYGIVYATDAEAEPRVRVVATFPAESHPPILYPAAVTRDAAAPGAALAFLDFLRGDEARAIFARHGFGGPG